MTKISLTPIAERLGRTLAPLGYELQPYVVGPTGVGVFKLALSKSIAAYVNVVYYEKYRALGAGLGFGFDALKAVTDDCLSQLAARKGLSARNTTSNPCPATLFVLDCFVGPERAQPIPLTEGYEDALRSVIDEEALGKYRWVETPAALCTFLMNGEGMFEWHANVPRRLCHAAYLMSREGVPLDVARERFSKLGVIVGGDADFDRYPGDLVGDVLEYFYLR